MLNTCMTCDGFVPQTADACPHCGVATQTPSASASPLSGLARSALAAASAGMLAVTLMACYGIGPIEQGSGGNGGEGGAGGAAGAGGEGGTAGAGGTGGAGGAGGAGGK